METLIPLEEVNIIIKELDYGTSSGIDGNFKIAPLIEGQYTIEFSHIGYISQKIIFNSSFSDDLLISMVKTKIDHEPVMVTGLHLERPLKDSPIITEIITSRDIQRYSSSSILDLLEKTIPNIKILNDSHGSTMSINGLDSKYFLFLIDGNRMIGETTGNIDFSRLNTSNIERIEILNGGASTLYGSGAIGGVINIISKQHPDSYSLNIKSKHYSKNRDIQNWITFGFNNKNRRIKSLTNISKKSSNGYSIKIENSNNIIQNEYSDISINQNFIFLPSDLFKLDISGIYYSHDTEDYNLNNKRRDKYYDRQLIINSQYVSDKKNIFKISYNYDQYDKYTLFEALQNQERIRSSHKLNLLNVNYSKKINDLLSCFIGYENHSEKFYSPSDLTYNPFAGYLGSDSLESLNINSIYSQIEYIANSSIQLILGVRYDVSSTFGSHLGPHLSLLYRKPKNIYRLNISKNFKSPSLKELYMQWDHFGMFYINGNQNLEPETSTYIGLSYEKIHSKYNLSIKPYMHKLHNMILSVEEFESSQMIYRNYKSVFMSGIDLYIKTHYNSIVFDMSVGLLEPRELSTEMQLDGTNKITINSSLTFFINNKKSNLNVNYKYFSDTYYSYGNVLDFQIVNISYNNNIYKGVDFSLGVDNLINTSDLNNRMTIYPDIRYYFSVSFNK